MSFSIAAIPASFMLQHRQPLASSKNSSDFSADGSSGEDTLIALAFGCSLSESDDYVKYIHGPSISYLDVNTDKIGV